MMERTEIRNAEERGIENGNDISVWYIWDIYDKGGKRKMLSRTVLKGRLVRDPMLKKKIVDERTVKWAFYRLAVNTSREYADYINCVSFGWNAEFIVRHAKKGTAVIVSGRLRSYAYDKLSGEKVSAVQLLVDTQGLCANWINGQEMEPERRMAHEQDFPELTLEDLEILEADVMHEIPEK